MWPVAASFACLVHDGDAPGIDAFLAAVDPADADAFAIALAAMVPVETATPGDLLAWVGGPRDEPELPLEWPRGGGPKPEPERFHDPAVLRDAHAKAVAAKRAGRVVPRDVKVLEAEYDRWRRREQASDAA
jgi:hypothetical protein